MGRVFLPWSKGPFFIPTENLGPLSPFVPHNALDILDGDGLRKVSHKPTLPKRRTVNKRWDMTKSENPSISQDRFEDVRVRLRLHREYDRVIFPFRNQLNYLLTDLGHALISARVDSVVSIMALKTPHCHWSNPVDNLFFLLHVWRVLIIRSKPGPVPRCGVSLRNE